MTSNLASRALRIGLLPACLGLASCHNGDDGAVVPGPDVGAGEIAVVSAFPALSFSQPLFFTQSPGDDTRSFVVTQEGVIYVFEHDADAAEASVFLDINDLVTDDGGELGLLGLAFDPDYANNGFFYVNYNPNYTVGGINPLDPRRTQISRFQVTDDPDVADPDSETPLLSYEQPFANHNGGWLAFGPDGKLYIASGDGGSAGDPNNNAQNTDSLLGKILRINPDGTAPSDNPFASGGGAGEVWAFGLRNPYRASFDRATGELLAGDVGQDNIEEIDVIIKGGNYGWRKYEGSEVYNQTDPEPENPIFPIFEYTHENGRCTVIGGYVYRGMALAGRSGDYFYADYCSGELWTLRREGAAATSTLEGQIPGSPTSFGEDNAGEIYVTSFDGKIYKLVPGS